MCREPECVPHLLYCVKVEGRKPFFKLQVAREASWAAAAGKSEKRINLNSIIQQC